MADKSEIAIIIPVFKEQDTIAKVLGDIDHSLREPATVYLIADNLPNAKRVQEVLAHEAVGHAL